VILRSKFRFKTKMTIFTTNLNFCLELKPKCGFPTEIFEFWLEFQFLDKMSIFNINFRILARISIFRQNVDFYRNFRILARISSFRQNVAF